MTSREKIQYGLIGIILVGGAVILARNMIRKNRANTEERKTYVDGSAATYAKLVKMSFENDAWPGTDEEALRASLIRIPSKSALRDVMTSYERLYNSSLLRDMKNELQSTEYNEMLAIINAKPERYNANAQTQNIGPSVLQLESWAARLKAAFSISYGLFPGTDEDAIKAVFLEVPTQAAYTRLAETYKNLYGSELMAALKSELEFWEYQPMLDLITRKPQV